MATKTISARIENNGRLACVWGRTQDDGIENFPARLITSKECGKNYGRIRKMNYYSVIFSSVSIEREGKTSFFLSTYIFHVNACTHALDVWVGGWVSVFTSVFDMMLVQKWPSQSCKRAIHLAASNLMVSATHFAPHPHPIIPI